MYSTSVCEGKCTCPAVGSAAAAPQEALVGVGIVFREDAAKGKGLFIVAMANGGPAQCAPEPGTRNPKPQTPNPKPQTPNPKPQTPNPKLQTRNREQADAAEVPAVRERLTFQPWNFKPDTPKLRTESRNPKSET